MSLSVNLTPLSVLDLLITSEPVLQTSIITIAPSPPLALIAPPGSPEPVEGSDPKPPSRSVRSPEVVTPSSPPKPFQKTRPSRHSTVSVELVPTAPEQVRGCVDNSVAGPGEPGTVGAHAPPSPGSCQDPVGSTGAAPHLPNTSPLESPLESPRVVVGTPEETRRSAVYGLTELFGVALPRAVPLPLDLLRFPWPLHARTGVTVSEISARAELRPDFARIRKIRAVGLIEQASSALVRLMSEGDGVGYQIAEEIRCDRTFPYSVWEVEYVDRMASSLFGAGQKNPSRFVLSEIKSLYVCPRPYLYTKPLAALQKSACTLMRLHSIAVAHLDWAAYRRDDEKDGRVFRSACFEHGLSPADFPVLPAMVRDSFPSLGVHPLLPYVLKYFGYAFAEEIHPAYPTLVSHREREWAWSVCNAVSTELGVNGRVFVQSAATLDFLERVTPGLPRVSLNPSDRGYSHVVWTYAAVLDLLRRAGEVGEHIHRPWTDFSTGERSVFVLYDFRGNGFLARSTATPLRPRSAGLRSGVGSAARSARRKRYRDPDAKSPVPFSVGSNPFRVVTPHDAEIISRGTRAPSDPLPVPPLRPVEGGPSSGSLVDHILTPGELGSLPDLLRALGASSDRAWSVGTLLSTMVRWYFARSDEAQRLRNERDSYAAEYHRVRRHVETLRADSLRSSKLVPRLTADRDRYRAERDELRASRTAHVEPRSAPQEVPPLTARPVRRDPYAHWEAVPQPPGELAAGGGTVGGGPYDPPVQMPALAEVSAAVPRHPGYYTPSSYGVDAAESGGEAGR